MSVDKVEILKGNKIEILEMVLKNVNNQLELLWKIHFENDVSWVIFSNVSRLRIGELSIPLEIHGFEIINHSQNGWEKESTYEICDFEDARINFFCEHITIDK